MGRSAGSTSGVTTCRRTGVPAAACKGPEHGETLSTATPPARKYRLILILAHQFIGQLKEEISKAVFGNVGSLISFRIGPEDAEFLEKQFAPVFGAQDIINVDNYQCFVRLLMNNELTKPFNMKTYPPTSGDQEVANALKELSRLRYGRDAAIVNREIMNRIKLAEAPRPASLGQ